MMTSPGHSSRRAAREALVAGPTPAPAPKKRRLGLWIALAVAAVVLTIGGAAAWVGIQVYEAAQATRSNLVAAMSHAQGVKTALLSADIDAARVAVASTQESSDAAVSHASGIAWEIAEAVPFGIGENVRSVRVVAELTDDLVDAVAQSVDGFNLAALAPQQGTFNLEALADLKATTAGLAAVTQDVVAKIDSIDVDQLVGPVRDGVDSFAAEAQTLNDAVTPIDSTLALLPEALGSAGPRDYIVMLQGNSEARSLGGNPAVYLVVRAEAGAISIVNYVDTVELPNGMDTPILPLTDEEMAIYGDKIGRWTPDLTMVPDFPRAVEILNAYWQNSVGTPYNGVISIDPVALSYLLSATGPVSLEDGQQLTADNAAAMLLNGVYFEYTDGYSQNAFFAGAASAIFTAMTTSSPAPVPLISALARAADEGRLLYWSNDPDEAAAIVDSRLAGRMPADSEDRTTLGVFVNDNTGSKKSYYLDLATGYSEVCSTSTTTALVGTATLSSTLSDDTAATLPYYIRGPHFAPAEISSHVIIYGPTGSTLTSITLDGNPAPVLTSGEHLGRPAIKIDVLNVGVSTHTLQFTFTLSHAKEDLGEVEIWSTPLSRQATAAQLETGCEPES